MSDTLPLLKGKISLQDALGEDIDIVQELSYPEKRLQFWLHLFTQRQYIAELASRHLNVRLSDIRLGEVEDWIHGSFNACIPIHIISQSARASGLPPRAIIRFPLPYKVGEASCPGNVDEKLRCEAATYIWLQQNCPDVPIPRLFGFGLPGRKSFTTVEREPYYKQVIWYIRRAVMRLFGSALTPYVSHNRCHLIDDGYLVLEHVDDGKMLSESWETGRHDVKRRANLFGHLSRIMLRLAKLPLPRIGSWTIDDRGVLKLANRPLTLFLYQLENADIPTELPRDRTYGSSVPYLFDLINCHDNRMRHQPNSIHHQHDGETQLGALTAMRALLPKLIGTQSREGPFAFCLTDLHQSNIFIDDDWRITNIIDLEWACSRPVEMLGPPAWLSSRSIEEIAFHFDEFTALHDEFVDTMGEQEMALDGTNVHTELMRASWASGSYWYGRALDSPTALLALYVDHIQPRFAEFNGSAWEEFSRLLMRLWDVDSLQFVSAKVQEQEQYADQLRAMFAPCTREE
ncbi:hypothetical protein H9Q69_010364 [Fusarium xylarioides]|nr:hypothetical protein H9Q69_010364 [Fusarium xylarioides]KAG5801982.1 hypothetical protein H9Q71_013435 [Fusarium xylarioides]KAG5815580.1 hypothetical protein H9Q74_011602 [Fusarium xylarioides]